MIGRCGLLLSACLLCMQRLQVVLGVPVEPCPAGAAATSCEDDRLNTLMSWAALKGIYAAKLRAGHPSGVRGLVAQKRIKHNGLMLSVPRSIAIILSQEAEIPFPHLLEKKEWAQLPEMYQLAVLLLYEAKQGTASDYHPWIQSLPSSFDTLAQWTSAELEELQLGSTIAELDFRSQVDDQATDRAHAYDLLKKSKFAKELNVTYQDFEWAANVVSSRSVAIPPAVNLVSWMLSGICLLAIMTLIIYAAFRNYLSKSKALQCLVAILMLGVAVYLGAEGGEDSTALLPVFDLLNHDARQEGSWLSSSWTGTHLSITAAGPDGFDPGQEATVSYGKKPNEAFLLHYGFVDTSYKNDFYSADLLELVQQQHTISQERISALAQRPELLQSVQSMSLRKGGAEREVHKALRYLLVPDDELQQIAKESESLAQWIGDYLEYRQRPDALTPFEYRLMSQPTELKVQQVLLQFCTSVLDRKPSTVKADQAELAALGKQKQLGRQHQRKILALQYRIGKKKILQSCIRKHTRLIQQISGS